jgi:hypothetical protein
MSDTKNDEKLRILQERLAQIKQKQETPDTTSQQRESVSKNITSNNVTSKREEKSLNLSWIKKTVIVVSLAFGIFYIYTNIDLNSIVPSLLSEKISQKQVPTQLEYKFNLEGRNIAIVSTPSSITDEGSAKAMVNDLKVKGFKCDYIYLPEKSNSKEEVYKVFIGPYENEEETNQWAKNLESEFNIITL